MPSRYNPPTAANRLATTFVCSYIPRISHRCPKFTCLHTEMIRCGRFTETELCSTRCLVREYILWHPNNQFISHQNQITKTTKNRSPIHTNTTYYSINFFLVTFVRSKKALETNVNASLILFVLWLYMENTKYRLLRRFIEGMKYRPGLESFNRASRIKQNQSNKQTLNLSSHTNMSVCVRCVCVCVHTQKSSHALAMNYQQLLLQNYIPSWGIISSRDGDKSIGTSFMFVPLSHQALIGTTVHFHK
jgi:hypothetical protein